MPVNDQHYTDEDGAIFVQASPGKVTYYAGGCFDVGDLPNPKADRTPFYCLDANRQYQLAGSTQSPPGTATFDVTGLVEAAGNWLEKFAEDACPFIIHFLQHKCGARGVFGNWERVYSYNVLNLSNDTVSGLGSMEGGNKTTRAFAMTASPFRVDSREFAAAEQTTTEDQAANDICACPSACAGACGDAVGVCDVLHIACDAVGAGTANVLRSTDGGTTWAATAADPFAADENIMAIVCFPINRTTNRVLCVRDGDAAAALEVAYTDDAGATWTNATVGATLNEAGTGPQCLFAFDMEHIWLCTDDGNVFFSDDGGATWTDQGALGASGANALQAVWFEDYNLGVAVGAADTVIVTDDGGATWTAATATGGGNTNNTVQIFDRGQHIIVGDNGGDMYHSFDGATTWGAALPASRWPGAGVGEVQCMEFCNDLTGLALHDTAAPVGALYHTVDGGYSWRAIATPANLGMNSVIMCKETLGYAVGEVNAGAVAEIVKASA